MSRELQTAVTAAEEAGRIILKYYRSDYEVADKGFSFLHGGHSPVTTADHASNDHLKKVLLSEFPQDGWFSEETADSPERLHRERVWIVDPLDGTKEFIEGVPDFVVSVALAEDHLPVLGVLYNPVTQETFTAVRGEGTRLNGTEVRCSGKSDPREMAIVSSRTETRHGLWSRYKDAFSELIPFGSVAYKLGLTAAGRADVFVSLRPKNEWDICAGHCLINEAGGKLLDLKGREVTYNNKRTRISPGLVAGNPAAVDNTLAVLKK